VCHIKLKEKFVLVFQQIMLERLENTCKKKTKKELTENTHAKENK
jgi:hypothetical protein